MDHPENLIIEPVDEAQYATKPVQKNNKTEKISLPVVKLNKTNQTTEVCTFDKLDMSIIRILSTNARASFTKIAKKLGVSTNTVIQRYNRLKKDALPYSSITLDLRKLGYIGNVEFRIKVSRQHNSSQVFKEICKVPNVIVAMKCLGTCDILAIAPFKNIDDLFNLNHSVSAVGGVQELELIVDKPFPTWPINVFFPIIANLPQKDYI